MKIIFYILLLISFNSFSQTIEITGKVIDNNKHPILYTNIHLKNSNIGTITNDNGEFKLNIHDNINDTLIISQIGYKKKYIPIKQINFSKILNIILIPKTYNIKQIEVISQKPNPYKILKEVKAKYKKSFTTTPYIAKSYIRQYYKLDSNFVTLTESLFKNYVTKYKDFYNFLNNPLIIDSIKYINTDTSDIIYPFSFKLIFNEKISNYILPSKNYYITIDTAMFYDNDIIYVISYATDSLFKSKFNLPIILPEKLILKHKNMPKGTFSRLYIRKKDYKLIRCIILESAEDIYDLRIYNYKTINNKIVPQSLSEYFYSSDSLFTKNKVSSYKYYSNVVITDYDFNLTKYDLKKFKVNKDLKKEKFIKKISRNNTSEWTKNNFIYNDIIRKKVLDDIKLLNN